MRLDSSQGHWRGQTWVPFRISLLFASLCNDRSKSSLSKHSLTGQPRLRRLDIPAPVKVASVRKQTGAMAALLPFASSCHGVGLAMPPAPSRDPQPLSPRFLQQQLMVLKIGWKRVVVVQLWTSQQFTGIFGLVTPV